ncbi:MAG TPA: hypothetical protein VK932_07535, partial [Kofleriaceae bacterium]|nr:hypothetical protein [Kofleriaceae bacterium]
MAKALALAAGVLAAALTTTLTGCFGGASAFTCSTNEQCNANGIGTCQPDNLCSYADASCMQSGQRYGDNAGDQSGKCVGESGGGDGGMNDVCYGAPNGLVRPCFSSAPTEDITLPGTIDTDTSTLCGAPLSGGNGYCVIAANNITLDDSVAATGSKPLVLVAASTITIEAGPT